MENSKNQITWQFHHREQLRYRTTGSPIIWIKFYHFPSYRQKITLIRPPNECKLQQKKINSFYIFNKKVSSRGSISLERIVGIQPLNSQISLKDNWGEISEISLEERQKYSESSQFWPTQSSLMDEILNEEWFLVENMNNWVKKASLRVLKTIKIRENQEKRLGAQKAIAHGVGDCDEFTDLFITITRLRGLPSRPLTGYYVTDSGRSMEAHAWAEIYSPTQSWIPIDLAMNNIGQHDQNYVIQKIEEFNPSLPDFQLRIKHSRSVTHEWNKPHPQVASFTL
ncbi:MAG: transglutaminase-like domain-containing protein [Candidatus Hodarchaeales archaeon]